MKKILISTVPYNVKGQDWFVGDIHGSFSRLLQTLKASGFDFESDRLFSVGDLVDRGGESHFSLNWIDKPWFFPIRGNHEDMYLTWRAYVNGEYPNFDMEWYKKNGGGWVESFGEDRHQEIESRIAKLPYLITILGKDNKPEIGVLHGEMPDTLSWAELNKPKVLDFYLQQVLWGRDRLLSVMYPNNPYTLAKNPTRISRQSLWEKVKNKFLKLEIDDFRQYYFEDEHKIRGIKAIVCGHATIRKSFSRGNIAWIDTGGWLPYGKGHYTLIRKSDVLELVANNTKSRELPVFAYHGGI